MNFTIEKSPVFSVLKIDFLQNEQFRAEAGAMMSMSPTLTLEAQTSGKGFLGTIKAAVGGESFFASLFNASLGSGELLLSPTVPGDIIQINLENNTIYAEGGAYLAGSPELEISTKGSFKAMVAGEGLFLQKITGTGTLFLNSYGAIIEKSLNPGENYIVDTGHIVAFEKSLTYQIKKAAKGIFSTLASGEGFVCEFSGPGKIWMQTRNLTPFIQLMQKIMPAR